MGTWPRARRIHRTANEGRIYSNTAYNSIKKVNIKVVNIVGKKKIIGELYICSSVILRRKKQGFCPLPCPPIPTTVLEFLPPKTILSTSRGWPTSPSMFFSRGKVKLYSSLLGGTVHNRGWYTVQMREDDICEVVLLSSPS